MRCRYEPRIGLIAMLGWAPAAMTATVLALTGDFSTTSKWMIVSTVVLPAFAVPYLLHQLVAGRMTTLSTIIITAISEDVRVAHRENAIAERMAVEIGALAELLEKHELQAAEGAALLRTVLAQLALRQPVRHRNSSQGRSVLFTSSHRRKSTSSAPGLHRSNSSRIGFL